MTIAEYDGGNVGSVGFGYQVDPRCTDTPPYGEANDQDDGPGEVRMPGVPGTAPGVSTE